MSVYLYAYLQTAGADQRGPKEDNCAIKEIKNIKNMNNTSKKTSSDKNATSAFKYTDGDATEGSESGL